MSDHIPLAPFPHEGLDPASEPKSPIAEVSHAVKGTANRVAGAIKAGRKPGMPLSILSNIAREALLALCWSPSCWELPSPAVDDGLRSSSDGSIGESGTLGGRSRCTLWPASVGID